MFVDYLNKKNEKYIKRKIFCSKTQTKANNNILGKKEERKRKGRKWEAE